MISWDNPSYVYSYFGNIEPAFKALMLKEGWKFLCEITLPGQEPLQRLAIFRRKV